ncbi:MAG: DNA translocase FtsK 4TM domain-containing protein, partial [Puniceicoccales bacterium]
MAAKAKKKKAAPQKKSFAPREHSRPLWGVLVLVLGCFLGVAMVDFEPSQSSQLVAGAESAPNLAGEIGAETSVLLLRMFGAIAWLFPPLIVWIAFLLLFKRAHRVRLRLFLSLAVFIMSLTGLANLIDSWGTTPTDVSPGVQVKAVSPGEDVASSTNFPQGLGGLAGRALCNPSILAYLGPVGNALLLVVITLFSALFLFTDNIGEYLRRRQEAKAARDEARAKEQAIREKERARLELEAKHAAEQAKKEKVEAAKPPSTKKAILADDGPKNPRKPLARGQSILGDPEPAVDDFIPDAQQFDIESEQVVEPPAPPVEEEAPAPPRPTPTTTPKRDTPIAFPAGKTTPPFKTPGDKEEAPKAPRRVGGITIVESEKTEKAAEKRPDRIGDYVFPPMDLLSDPPQDSGQSDQDYEEMMGQLVQTLEEFNVKVSPAEVLTGPVITRYEVTPAPGVRVEKILNLDKNIALGLKADAVRIIAPVPGKGTVGVEVPRSE